MRKWLTVVTWFAGNTLLFAQLDCTRWIPDGVGASYCLLDQQIKKYNQKGETIFQTSTFQWGMTDKLDLTLPLQPTLFISNPGIILTYDNTLTLQGEPLYLNSLGFGVHITQIALSKWGGFWTFDDANLTLSKWDWNGQLLAKNNNLTPILLHDSTNIRHSNPTTHVTWMEESGNVLFMGNETQVWLFDRYGDYLQSITLPNQGSCLLDSGKLIQITDSVWFQLYPDFIQFSLRGPITRPFGLKNNRVYSPSYPPTGIPWQEFVNN
jgi:hypothetical protein